MAAMTTQRVVTSFVLLYGLLYLLLLISEWLTPSMARLNAGIIGAVGAGLCAIFGARLISRPREKPTA